MLNVQKGGGKEGGGKEHLFIFPKYPSAGFRNYDDEGGKRYTKTSLA